MPSPDDPLHALIDRCELDPAFIKLLQKDTKAALELLEIKPTTELVNQIAAIDFRVFRKVRGKRKDIPGC